MDGFVFAKAFGNKKGKKIMARERSETVKKSRGFTLVSSCNWVVDSEFTYWVTNSLDFFDG